MRFDTRQHEHAKFPSGESSMTPAPAHPDSLALPAVFRIDGDSLWLVAADAVVVVHLAFVVFAVLGGLLVLRWRRVAWVHLPTVAWAALVELAGWVCPLTPLENRLREKGGSGGYEGGFIDHYLLPILYPDTLTRDVQVTLGVLVLVVNLAVYTAVLVRIRAQRRRNGVSRR